MASNIKISPLIEADELLKIYKALDVMIFDVSNGQDARENYEALHLEGAFFIDLNTQLSEIKEDFAQGGRHPLPHPAVFSKTLTALGITKNTHIVLYDNKYGSNASARFWWMLKSAGHEKVQVLDGGVQQAKKVGFPFSSKTETAPKAVEVYRVDAWILPTATMGQVEEMVHRSDFMVVDVREKARFDGISEPIDLVAGNIPGAKNIPFTENLDAEGRFLSPDQLQAKYRAGFGEVQSENVIVHCGSGVTACHTILALSYAGMALPTLYVGSWSEWSRNCQLFYP